jgi:hypothetical protein
MDFAPGSTHGTHKKDLTTSMRTPKILLVLHIVPSMLDIAVVLPIFAGSLSMLSRRSTTSPKLHRPMFNTQSSDLGCFKITGYYFLLDGRQRQQA